MYKHAKDTGRRRRENFDEGEYLKPLVKLKIEEPFQVGPAGPVTKQFQLTLNIPESFRQKPLNPRTHDVVLSVTSVVEGAFIAATAIHTMTPVSNQF